MGYTAEHIKEIFLEYSAHKWAINSVYINGIGKVDDLEQWFIDRWKVILTNKKGTSAEIMLSQVEKVLKSDQKDIKRTSDLSVSDTPYAFDKQYFAEKDKKDKKDIHLSE